MTFRDDPSYYEGCQYCGDDAIGMTGLCHSCHESAEAEALACEKCGSDEVTRKVYEHESMDDRESSVTGQLEQTRITEVIQQSTCEKCGHVKCEAF